MFRSSHCLSRFGATFQLTVLCGIKLSKKFPASAFQLTDVVFHSKIAPEIVAPSLPVHVARETIAPLDRASRRRIASSSAYTEDYRSRLDRGNNRDDNHHRGALWRHSHSEYNCSNENCVSTPTNQTSRAECRSHCIR